MEQKKTKWPSLEAQLAKVKAPHGSPLEELIKDNQDFEMLRPEEAHDNLEYPLWLRVYCRKKFPHFRYHAADPSGGYPGSLDKLLRLMLHSPNDPAWKPGGKEATHE